MQLAIPARILALISILFLASCSSCDDDTGTGANTDTVQDAGSESTPDAQAEEDANGAEDMATASDLGDDAGSRQDYCDGDGPPVIDTESETLCTGEIAEVGFRFALCSCSGIVASNTLTTSSIDSVDNMSGRSASVGTNGGLNATGNLDIGGSLIVASDQGITSSGELDASGNLESGGDLSVTSSTVGNDARVEGDIVVGNQLDITGTLQQPQGSSQTGTINTGATDRSALDVAPPCDCETEQLLPVDDIIDSLTAANDNADVAFDSESLRNVSNAVTLEVPCGRFLLSGIDGGADVTLNVAGRSALVIDGDVSLGGELTVNVAEGAELDLFIGGNVNFAGGATIGDPDRPAATRIYVAGSGTIQISGDVSLNANLYAPLAEVVAAADTEIRGSVFTRRLAASGAFSVVYDEAVLEVGEDCPDDPNDPDDPDMCDSCRDCRNQACVDGTCGECQTDSDCCSPFLCLGGVCDLLL